MSKRYKFAHSKYICASLVLTETLSLIHACLEHGRLYSGNVILAITIIIVKKLISNIIVCMQLGNNILTLMMPGAAWSSVTPNQNDSHAVQY